MIEINSKDVFFEKIISAIGELPKESGFKRKMRVKNCFEFD